MLLRIQKPRSLSKRPNLITIPTNMHHASAIRARHIPEPWRLRLALQRGIATAQQRIAQVVETMAIVPYRTLIECKVFVADLQHELVHGT